MIITFPTCVYMIGPLYQQLILVLFIEHMIVSCQCTPQLGWTDKWPGHWGSNGIIFPQSGMENGIIVCKHIYFCMIIFSMEIYSLLCTMISWCKIKQNWTQQESDRAQLRIWFHKLQLTYVSVLRSLEKTWHYQYTTCSFKHIKSPEIYAMSIASISENFTIF